MTGDEPAEGESPPMLADCAEGVCHRADPSWPVVSEPQAGSLCCGGIDRPFLLALVVVMLLAAWLRALQMNESLWLDELHTAWTVCDGWREIPWRAEIGNQSPLYFYGVALTTRIGGLSEVTLRLPSALAGVVLVGLAGWLVARWTGLRIAGLLTALLLAVDHTVLFYAQEARPYAWVQLLGLIHVAAFVQLLARPQSGWRALWIASAIVMYYLHYTASLLLVAEVVAYGVLWAVGAWRNTGETRQAPGVHAPEVDSPKTGQAPSIHDPEPVPFSEWKPGYRLRQFAADLSLVALGMLPSIPHVAQIAARRDAWSMFIGSDPAPARIFSLFPLDIYLLLPAGIGIAAWAWRLKKGTGVVFAQTGCRPARFPHENDSRPLFPTVVAVCWLFVPLVLAWILTVADIARLFFLRYLVVSAIAPAVLTGLMLRLYPGRLSRVAGSVAVVVTLAWHSGLMQQYALDGRVIGDRRQDWRGAVKLFQQRAVGSSVPVFVRSGLIEADRLRDDDSPQLHQYCLLPVRGIYRLDLPPDDLIPLPTSRSSELTAPQISRIAAAGQAFFLLVGSPRSIARQQRQLADSLTAHGLAMIPAEHYTFGDVAVLHYVIHDRSDPKPNESR